MTKKETIMVSMSKAKIEDRKLPKRFYATAAWEAIEGGYVITLDGKRVRTPQQKLLHCASQQLAAEIATEWQAQGQHIDTDTMPLTRLLNITLDRVEADREVLLVDITNYAQTDLLCYRAPMEEHALGLPSLNQKLRVLQLQHFDPILAWAEEVYDARFVCTDGLVPVAQPQASLTKIAAVFAAANSHELAALALITPILGSALLTLALWKGRLDANEALSAAHLDETVHATAWGDDHEVVEKWAAKCRDAKAAALFLASHAN
jgi:chaperone required for assembly of F1-ATPase